MSEPSPTDESDPFIQLDPMSIDQLAGAVVLFLGAVGSLLLVVWQSKCFCRVNLCYLFECERRPPNEEEMKTLKEKAKDLKKGQEKINKKEDQILEKEEEILDEVSTGGTPRLVPKKTKSKDDILPYPDEDLDKLV